MPSSASQTKRQLWPLHDADGNEELRSVRIDRDETREQREREYTSRREVQERAPNTQTVKADETNQEGQRHDSERNARGASAHAAHPPEDREETECLSVCE